MNFYAVMIDHYEQRINDTSVPLMVRAEFKRALAKYRSRYEETSNQCRFSSLNKSITMSVITVSKIKASDIINTAEQLKKKNLNHTEVDVVVHEDHISIVNTTDKHLLSYIKREVKPLS